ncbi:hypothetical protein F4779DRAFT_604807 [Xylariaceae sp. FL0662B]|nr:hypothetical protein F4779DRAFT_604807 [Xylariaceae sp. FL0662B]
MSNTPLRQPSSQWEHQDRNYEIYPPQELLSNQVGESGEELRNDTPEIMQKVGSVIGEYKVRESKRANTLDCSPYCPSHRPDEVRIHQCELARARPCPVHDTEGFLDHYCGRPRWRTETLGDHYCPCPHDLADLQDHYCPCPHDEDRRTESRGSCPHRIRQRTDHYCPLSRGNYPGLPLSNGMIAQDVQTAVCFN